MFSLASEILSINFQESLSYLFIAKTSYNMISTFHLRLIILTGLKVHRRVTPSIKFAGTHLYSWVERGTVRVKCFAQEHKTMSTAMARTRTTQSGVELTNHEATAPPNSQYKVHLYSVLPIRSL